jgi:hypothetical protein
MTYPDTRIRVGQVHDAVLMPPALLSARRCALSGFTLAPVPPDTAVTAYESAHDFVESLRFLLRPYLLEGYPPIDVVAELAG